MLADLPPLFIWKRTFVKMSNSLKFAGSSSVPKGFRSGAFATYCLRVYSSNSSGLFTVNEGQEGAEK